MGTAAGFSARPSAAGVATLRRVKKAAVVSGGVLVLSMLGCTHGASLRQRSAGDMHCPAESVKIYAIDDRSYRVIGCDQEFVYVSTCETPNAASKNCTWVLNSHRGEASVQSSGEAAAPGCSYDAQCKGERICVKHECVTPPSEAPAPNSQN